jgi:acetamidase/formamidase
MDGHSIDQVRADVAALDFARVNPVSGPVFVKGAQPGDALEVEILEFDARDWGWTAIIPGFGLLADEFSEPWLPRVHGRRRGPDGGDTGGHHLSDVRGFDRQEAYALCSVAANLRIHEVVDAPNWMVGAFIPDDIFTA